MNLWIYCRVSSEDQEKEGHGLDNQEERGRKLFATIPELTGSPVCVVREVQSGRKEAIEDRHDLKNALESLQFSDCIYFDDEDRMARDNGVKKAIIRQLRKKNIRLFVRTREFDLFNIQDTLQLGLKGEFDEYMGAWLVQRMHGGIVAAAKNKWISYLPPWGYQKDDKTVLRVDSYEGQYYDLMVGWVFEGIGMKEIARRLDRLGVPTKTMRIGKPSRRYRRGNYAIKFNAPKKWTFQTVYKILTSPLYTGEMTYYGHKVVIPRLISGERWEVLQELLAARKQTRTPRRNKRFYLLQGLLVSKRDGLRLFGKKLEFDVCCRCRKKLTEFLKRNPSAEKCPECGSLLRESLRRREEGTYRCLCTKSESNHNHPPCGLPAVNLKKVEQEVWNKVQGLAKNIPKLREHLETELSKSTVDTMLWEVEVEAVERAISEKKQRIINLLKSEGDIGHPEYLRQTISALDGEIEELTKQLGDKRKEIKRQELLRPRREKVVEHWKRFGEVIDNMIEQEKYDFLHAYVVRVIVDYDREKQKHTLELELLAELEDTAQVPKSLQKIIQS